MLNRRPRNIDVLILYNTYVVLMPDDLTSPKLFSCFRPLRAGEVEDTEARAKFPKTY